MTKNYSDLNYRGINDYFDRIVSPLGNAILLAQDVDGITG